VKGADLVAAGRAAPNLDYKLREELRTELPRIFEASGAIFVYGHHDLPRRCCFGGPHRLQCGGRYPAGRRDLRRSTPFPTTLRVAQYFPIPPLNTSEFEKRDAAVQYWPAVQAPGVRTLRRPWRGAPYRGRLPRPPFKGRQRHCRPPRVSRHRTVTEIHRFGKVRHLNRDASNGRLLPGRHELFHPGNVLGLRCSIRTIGFVFDAARPSGRVRRPRCEGHPAWPALTSFDLAHPTAAIQADLEIRFASKPATMTWRQGGAYAPARPSGCGKTHLAQSDLGHRHAVARQDSCFDRVDITPLSTRSANIAQSVPVSGDLRHHVGGNKIWRFPLKNRGVPKARSTRGSRRLPSCSISRLTSRARRRG